MYSSAYVWAKVLSHMEERLGSVTVSAWFDDAEVVELNENNLILYSPSDFRRDIIRRRCTGFVEDALKEVFNSDAKLLVFGDKERDSFRNKGKTVSSMDFNPQFTFDNFVVGPSNRFAHSASIAVSKNPGQVYNPLFIYGPSGVGKTHLLYAIANGIRRQNPEANIVYIKGDEFTNELISAIASGKNVEFRSKYRESDLFLIDDIQFIAGKESTQEEFFHTFNKLYEEHKQIVMTSDRKPSDMLTLEDRLRTRFEWGLLVDVQPPDFETRMAIISRKADSLGLALPEDVAAFIAGKLKDNVRQLEGVVKRLDAHANLTGAPITMLLAENAIQDIMTEQTPLPVTVDRIIDEVARTYGVTAEDIRGQRRSNQISTARQVAMYVVREITGMTQLEIGQEFGGRDHSTVVYALQQVTKAIQTDPRKKEVIEDIIKNIRNLNG